MFNNIGFKEIKKVSFGLTNFNYLIIDENNNKYFFKIYRYKSIESITNELNFINYLVKKNFPTPKIIINQNSDKCVVFEYIDGKHPKQNIDNIIKIGKLISKLHNIKIDREVNLNIGYSLNLKDIKEFKSNFNTKLNNLFEIILLKVESIPFDNLPKSATHCDIFLDNLIEFNNKVFLIDFEELAYENSIFDICRAMYGCCFKNNKLNLNLVKVMIYEYQKYRKLTDLEKEYIYEYTLYAGFISIFWRYREFNINRYDSEKSSLYKEFINALEILLNMKKEEFLKTIFSAINFNLML